MKTLLITGGTGFIGRVVCRCAMEAGYRVRVLSRNPGEASRLLPGATAFSAIDQAFAEPADVLVNLAGEPLVGRWTDQRKQAFFDSRVALTEGLVAAAGNSGHWPQTVISGSAIGFYGSNGDTPLDESSPGVDCFSHRLCAAWERAAHPFADKGARLVLLRTGIVLDREGGALQRMLPPFRMGLGGRIGSGRQWMSWVTRSDLVSLILHAIDHDGVEGPLNGTAPEPVSNRDFTRALARQLHRPAFMSMPAPLVRLAFGEMADELLLASQKVLPGLALSTGFGFGQATLLQALGDLLER